MKRSVRRICTQFALALTALAMCGSALWVSNAAGAAANRVVCPAPGDELADATSTEPPRYTDEALQTIANELRPSVGPWPMPVSAVGINGDAVFVNLRLGEERFASKLVRQYGDALRIRVGDMLYVPKGCGTPPALAPCPTITGEVPSTHGVELRLVAMTPEIMAGQLGEARLEIRNLGSEPFGVNVPQPVLGILVRRGTNDVVGYASYESLLLPSPRLLLAPGETGSVRVVFAAYRCGASGSTVPPGKYGLRAVLPPQIPAGPNVVPLLAPETPVRIVR